MNISLDSIHIVLAVVHEGGVNRAAKTLNKVPSAVSYTIQKLERDLGADLFTRQGRSLQLTDAGKKLVELGERLLTQATDVETAVRQVSNGWDTVLRIAISDVIPVEWILEIVGRLYDVTPQTHVIVTREVLAGSWEALLSGRVDIVVGAPNDVPLGRGIMACPMGQVELIIAVSPAHPLANTPDPVSNEVFRQHRVAVVPDTARSEPKMTWGFFPATQMLTVPDFEAKRAAQIRGLAVGALPRYLIVADLEAGRLVQKPLPKPYYETLQLAWRTENTGKALSWFRQAVQRAGGEWLIKPDVSDGV